MAPLWLNASSDNITIVTHRDIYPVQSHLPTFSSPSTESRPVDYYRDDVEIIYVNPAYPSSQFFYEVILIQLCSI